MTNTIRKVRVGVDIFDKRILDSCKFILDLVLQNTASFTAIFFCSRMLNGEWCTSYQDSTFYVSIFLVSGKRKGEERERETPPSLH